MDISLSQNTSARNEGGGRGILDLTSKIVAFYICGNEVACHELAMVIKQVHVALDKIEKSHRSVVRVEPQPVPAVPVKKSVTPDFIICLEDGKTCKSLKRYLASKYGMTPNDYRTKWRLPSDYPMVAPNYARARSEIARQIRRNRARDARTKGDAAATTPSGGAGRRGEPAF